MDNTSRVQTVSKEDNIGYYYNLIKKFYEKTGCPMVLNTSLNIKGYPIVNDHHDGIQFEKKIWSKSILSWKVVHDFESLISDWFV